MNESPRHSTRTRRTTTATSAALVLGAPEATMLHSYTNAQIYASRIFGLTCFTSPTRGPAQSRGGGGCEDFGGASEYGTHSPLFLDPLLSSLPAIILTNIHASLAAPERIPPRLRRLRQLTTDGGDAQLGDARGSSPLLL
eukprot:6205334-Pyramimonas_sp.AAC.1